jgi:uncharacterized protein (TIGR02246 family)
MRRSMLPLLATVIVAGFAATAHAAHAAPRTTVPEWATDFLHRWYAAFNHADAAAVAALFTPDARFATLEGRAEIEKGFAADFTQAFYHCEGEFDGLRELGTLAVGWGHESCLEKPTGAATSTRTHERWLLVLERQADGRWLLARETYEPVAAPAGRD